MKLISRWFGSDAEGRGVGLVEVELERGTGANADDGARPTDKSAAMHVTTDHEGDVRRLGDHGLQGLASFDPDGVEMTAGQERLMVHHDDGWGFAILRIKVTVYWVTSPQDLHFGS